MTKLISDILGWIANNLDITITTLIFMTVAVVIPITIKLKKNKQIQKSGKNCTNIQVGGNIHIGDSKKDD